MSWCPKSQSGCTGQTPTLGLSSSRYQPGLQATVSFLQRLHPSLESNRGPTLPFGNTWEQRFLFPQGLPPPTPYLTLTTSGMHALTLALGRLVPVQKSQPQTSPSGLQGYDLQLVTDPGFCNSSPCSIQK